MPKKVKLDLNDLKVTSFVTSLEPETSAQVKGGATADTCEPCTLEICPTSPQETCETYYSCMSCETCQSVCTCQAGGCVGTGGPPSGKPRGCDE